MVVWKDTRAAISRETIQLDRAGAALSGGQAGRSTGPKPGFDAGQMLLDAVPFGALERGLIRVYRFEGRTRRGVERKCGGDEKCDG